MSYNLTTNPDILLFYCSVADLKLFIDKLATSEGFILILRSFCIGVIDPRSIGLLLVIPRLYPLAKAR